MRPTPHAARRYLLVAAFLIALPTLASLYEGQTGKLLVAGERGRQGPFDQSVVLVVRHDLFRAYGFIINKPMDGGEQGSVPSFYGGPVGADTAVVLMGRGEDGTPVFGGRADDMLPQGRLLHGYAGWAPLQLDYEIVRGGWDMIDFDPALVFETPSEKIWKRARDKVLQEYPVGRRKNSLNFHLQKI